MYKHLYDVVILDFFCDILSLNVKMYLWLKLYTVPFFVSGQTYKISKGSNNYCSHCSSWCRWALRSHVWLKHSQLNILMLTSQSLLAIESTWVLEQLEFWNNSKKPTVQRIRSAAHSPSITKQVVTNHVIMAVLRIELLTYFLSLKATWSVNVSSAGIPAHIFVEYHPFSILSQKHL